MYTGHAAAALVLKSYAPRVPMPVLALASYGPDILEMLTMIPHPREGMGLYTHSVPAVAVGALVASVTYRLWTRSAGARVVAFAWMLHLCLDLFTGRKPLFSLKSLTGLDLYHLRWADFALETVVVIASCTIFARTFASTRSQRNAIALLGTGLIALQFSVDSVMSVLDANKWTPSFALVD